MVLWLAALGAGALIAGLAFAQATGLTGGELSGSATDLAGEALPGAKVTVTSTTLDFNQSMFTRADGTYYFQNLPPADYTVNVELTGFQPVTRHVSISHQTVNLYFELQIQK